jgi:adenylate kinase
MKTKLLWLHTKWQHNYEPTTVIGLHESDRARSTRRKEQSHYTHMTILNSISRNLCLVGPPGSGKGSYGKHFARALQLPLFSVSDLLRQFRPYLDLSSGKLIDDRIVTDTILLGLQQEQYSHLREAGGYILDGFPRTLRQAAIMEETWPASYQLQAAINLAVPDTVCETKLLGRRICTQCGENYNVNGVFWNGWDLPPYLPTRKCVPQCDPNHDWITREDDTAEIVNHRLKVYHENMDPILEYFEGQNRLLKLKPFRGFDDIPMLVEKVQVWLQEHEEEATTEVKVL